jgi:hypothetical protein
MTVSSRHLSLTLGLLAIASILSPRVSHAQGKEPLSQPKTVPIELVTALVGSGGVSGPESPRILVGSAPEWVMSKIVVPAGGHVLGAAFQGTTVLMIVHLPAAGDSVMPELRRALLEHGWKAVQVMQRPSVGGFMPAMPASNDATPTHLTVCGDGQILNATLSRRDEKSADIAYRLAAQAAMGPCHPPQMPTLPTRLPWPALTNPAGTTDARMTGECSATMMPASGIGTTLHTGMSADSIIAFYANQLADSGWKAETGRPAPVGRIFTRTDASGAPSELTLSVANTTNAESCRDVYMQVRTTRKP